MLDYKHTTKFSDNKTPESRLSTQGLRGLSRSNPNALPCGACGSQHRKLGAGKEPHSASLRCGECDGREANRLRHRFIKWIGKAELAKLNQGGY